MYWPRLSIVLILTVLRVVCAGQSIQISGGTRAVRQETQEAEISTAEIFARGQAALQAGDLAAAEQAFHKVIVRDPKAAGAYANLGVVCMRRKQWDQALTWMRKAERLEPREIGFRLNIGLIYFRQNDFTSAIKPLASVVQERPELSQARYLLGLSYFFTDIPAKAVDTLEPLWPEQSENLSYLYVLANAADHAERKDLEEKALARLEAVGQDAPELHLLKGKSHLSHEEYDDAITELQKAAAQNDSLPFLHFNLGLAYLHKEDLDRARDEFTKDAAIEPDVAFNYDELGNIYWRRQQYKEDEENFRKAIELDRRLPSSYFGLAQVYYQQGHYDAAMRELDAALKLAPDNSNLHYLRGRVLLRLDRKQEAQAEMNAATATIKTQRDARHEELFGSSPDPELTKIP